MSESQRTLAFVAAAVVCLGLGYSASPRAPKATADFANVGTPFYPDFAEASAASVLQVVSYNADRAEASLFSVEKKDGKWRIPSRHNYPADGKDRLAKAAAALIGLKRDALVGRLEADHAEFDVIDPMDEKSTALKGRGSRITIKSDDGKLLADLIIGKQVPGRTGHYYLRRPDEKQVYSAKFDLQLSTKFADWIEPDLLKLDGFKLTRVAINKHSVDEARGELTGEEVNILTRKNSSDPWKLKDLDEAAEEVNQDEVRKLVSALDDLKIVGIRTKPATLRESLKLNEGIQLDQFTAIDLSNKGYLLARLPDGSRQLISKEGEMTATTDAGIEYTLKFGDVFTGSEDEIEFGKSDKDAAAESKPAPKEESQRRSRYLFVTVAFDAEGLGEKPAEPVEPTPPEGYDPNEAPKDAGDAADATAPANDAAELAKQEYRNAKTRYEADRAKFEMDSKTFAEKVEAGEKQVKELNARFADWYYVISAESFDELRQGRKTLVKPKAATPAADPAK